MAAAGGEQGQLGVRHVLPTVSLPHRTHVPRLTALPLTRNRDRPSALGRSDSPVAQVGSGRPRRHCHIHDRELFRSARAGGEARNPFTSSRGAQSKRRSRRVLFSGRPTLIRPPVFVAIPRPLHIGASPLGRLPRGLPLCEEGYALSLLNRRSQPASFSPQIPHYLCWLHGPPTVWCEHSTARPIARCESR